MYLSVHCSTIYNRQYMEATPMSTERWMGKEDVVHRHNGILLSHDKERMRISSSEMNEPRIRYTEWRKSGTEKQIENSTKQLLNAGRRHQAPRKAAHSLWKEVGQKTKDKKRDKRVRDGDPSQEGSPEREEVSKYQETLSSAGLWGVLESQRAT